MNCNYGLSKEINSNCHQVNHQNTSERNAILKSAINEITIGSSDSIDLAITTLERENIQILALISLKQLQGAGRLERDEVFYQDFLKLQSQAIADINKLII